MTGNLTVLLTGATGLVGRFVLAELLRRQVPTVVLVRSQPLRDAHSRIDEALAEFEKHSLLPRPIVLEADLCRSGLGLSADAWARLKGQPLRIIHSAASIRFQADSPESEPYRSNVRGTQHLLEVAQQLQVKQFHHVSTAYVQCNRPSGSEARRTAFEVAVQSDAQAGNDYERSKIQSENLVLNCGYVGPVSIYRPSIVVGDSRTGYTSTFHGFYAPLQIAAAMAGNFGVDRSMGDLLRQQLGLASSDSKNLVPVDWLAAAIVHLLETPAALGGIYHLTHPQPAQLRDMQTAILDALEDRAASRHASRGTSIQATSDFPADMFSQQMEVYQSYFQDDAPFDRRRADEFLGGLPCPTMDYTALKRLASAALELNFGWPRPPAPPQLSRRLALRMRKAAAGHSAANLRDISFELQILGPHKTLARDQSSVSFCRSQGEWQLNSVLSSNVVAGPLSIAIAEQSLLSAISNSTSVPSMIDQGRLILKGPWPDNCVPVLLDWLAQLSIVDDQIPGQAII